MSESGKQTPLGVNVNGSLLQNKGFHINPIAQGYMGISKTNSDYSFGSVVSATCLRMLTWAINDAYLRGVADSGSTKTVTNTVYNNLIHIGTSTVPALGNTPPSSYARVDPSGRWLAAGTPATTGYSIAGDVGQGQAASWLPYYVSNPNVSVTQWGYIRLMALQAWNEFNWNGIPDGSGMPEYKDFLASFLSSDGFVNYSNTAINAMQDSKTFLMGTYSSMDDLISADITGVSLTTAAFRQDCITAGKVIDLSKIQSFGLPSVLLQTIRKNNAMSQSLSVALLSAGLLSSEIDDIAKGTASTITTQQQQQIYGAFLIIVGQDLQDVLIPLNCKTLGLNSLADLLNIKKLFPNSYKSLTVPIYNAVPGPTNSKTYYPIFQEEAVNVRLETPVVKAQVGTIIPPGPPPIVPSPPPPTPPYVAPIIEKIPEVIAAPAVITLAPSAVTVIPAVIPPAPPVPSGGGGCVVLESYVPLVEARTYNGNVVEQAYQLVDDFSIFLADENDLTCSIGTISKAINEYQPCIRITTKDGASLVCSTTARIPTQHDGVITAPDLLSKNVAVLRKGVAYWDSVVSIEDMGTKFVRVIDAGNNSFWAGKTNQAYILHHNANISGKSHTVEKM